MRARHDGKRHIGAAIAAAVLLAACSGSEPDQVEASQATPEPTIEAPPETDEPAETTSEEPESEPTIGEDEPLYAPLPDLEPDPDNDIPDEFEADVLAAARDAYEATFSMAATGRIDEAALVKTHFGAAEELVAASIRDLADQGLVERSPDGEVTRLWVRDAQGGAAITRECFINGPRSGLYNKETGELQTASPQGLFARERMIELVRRSGEDEPRFRVTDIMESDTEGCR